MIIIMACNCLFDKDFTIDDSSSEVIQNAINQKMTELSGLERAKQRIKKWCNFTR